MLLRYTPLPGVSVAWCRALTGKSQRGNLFECVCVYTRMRVCVYVRRVGEGGSAAGTDGVKTWHATATLLQKPVSYAAVGYDIAVGVSLETRVPPKKYSCVLKLFFAFITFTPKYNINLFS